MIWSAEIQWSMVIHHRIVCEADDNIYELHNGPRWSWSDDCLPIVLLWFRLVALLALLIRHGTEMRTGWWSNVVGPLEVFTYWNPEISQRAPTR